MADTKKPGTSTQKRGRTAAKPTTIDLDAKEISGSAAKGTQGQQSAKFGRDAASATRSSSASRAGSKSSTSKPAGSGAKPATSSTGNTAKNTGQDNKTPTASTGPSKSPSAAASDKQSTSTKTADNSDKASGSGAQQPPSSGKTASGGTRFGGIFSGVVSALAGAAAAIVGLGIIGQFDGASRIPLVGTLYESNDSKTAITREDMDLINARIDELAASNNNTAATDSVGIARLEQKIAELETSLAGAENTPDTERVGKLEQEVESLSTVVADLSETISGDSISQDGSPAVALAAVNAKIADLGKQLAAITQPDLAPVRSTIETVKADIASLRESLDKNSGEISAVSDMATRLDKEIETIRVNSKVAKTVALNSLGSALQNGRSLFTPVSSLEALGGVTEETRRLAELDRQGIPSTETLTSELRAIEQEVQNPETASSDASITDKLWANARSLVTVRSSGPREGDSVAAILSRVRANVENDELQAARDEWNTLPPETATRYQEWQEKLDRRLEAFQLYNALSQKEPSSAG